MIANTTNIRHLAKAATLTSIAERRLAVANRTSPMQHHPGTLEVGEMILNFMTLMAKKLFY